MRNAKRREHGINESPRGREGEAKNIVGKHVACAPSGDVSCTAPRSIIISVAVGVALPALITCRTAPPLAKLVRDRELPRLNIISGNPSLMVIDTTYVHIIDSIKFAKERGRFEPSRDKSREKSRISRESLLPSFRCNNTQHPFQGSDGMQHAFTHAAF